MIRNIALIATVVVVSIIVFATLSPLDLRPRTGFVGPEREAAFLLLGVVAVVAFPSHLWLVIAAMVASTIGLELAQHLTPDRHGHVADALQKLGGGLVGCALGFGVNRFLPS